MSAPQKHWSYQQITASAEASICNFMTLARAESSRVQQLRFSANAHGAFVAWYDMTAGEQKEGDFERLLQLTHLEASN